MNVKIRLLLEDFVCFCDFSCGDILAENQHKKQDHIGCGDVFDRPDMACQHFGIILSGGYGLVGKGEVGLTHANHIGFQISVFADQKNLLF